MKVAALVICFCSMPLSINAAAQRPAPSAADIVAAAGHNEGAHRREAGSAIARVATSAPNTARTDSITFGLMDRLQDSSETILIRGHLLNALMTLAKSGNVVATEGLFFYAEVLEPPLRAWAIFLLTYLPDRSRVMEAWRRAATDPDAEVASKAVEILAYSGPEGPAELQALVDGGEMRSPAARSWARDLIQVISQPRPQQSDQPSPP